MKVKELRKNLIQPLIQNKTIYIKVDGLYLALSGKVKVCEEGVVLETKSLIPEEVRKD